LAFVAHPSSFLEDDRSLTDRPNFDDHLNLATTESA